MVDTLTLAVDVALDVAVAWRIISAHHLPPVPRHVKLARPNSGNYHLDVAREMPQLEKGQAGAFSRESDEAAILRAAKDGVEITPEMIEEGIKAFCAWDDGDKPFEGEMVCSVYRAMLRESGVSRSQGA